MCSEVMYGAYYPYLYGRAGPSRPFYQYERVSVKLTVVAVIKLTVAKLKLEMIEPFKNLNGSQTNKNKMKPCT